MRRLFERVSDRLQGFVQQRDCAALIVECQDADCIAILKILEGLDEASASEFFWIQSTDFLDAPAYVSAVVKDFAIKHEGVQRGLEVKKMPPWPQIPPAILQESRSPVERLRELMAFSRSLLPGREGCLAVWVLCPLHIADALGYDRLMADVLRHEYPFPWFHHLRLILRQDTGQRDFSPVLAGTPRIDRYIPDLSETSMENAIEEEAADEALPLAERVQATFVSASRDASYGRFDEALQKHEIVLRYHTAIGNREMVALVLNSVGETHQRLGRQEQAGECFEAALEPASEGPNPALPVLFNILINLAALRSSQSRFSEAEVYYDAAEKLATVLRNPTGKIQSIENVGYCQLMQGKNDEAVASWRHGALIAGKLEQPALEEGILARLQQHLAQTNQASAPVN